MSDLMNAAQGNFRKQLLTTVSTLALLASVCGTHEARAEDSEHAIVWIEVGGAFDQMSAGDTRWLPPNLTLPQTNPRPGPFGKMPAVGYDVDLKLSFMPADSDWIFSAAVRYGRAIHGPKNSHDQTYKFNVFTQSGAPIKYILTNQDFANTIQKSRATHAILDFQAGKDMGLGLFGGTSVLSAGIRVAKLNESADGHLTAFLSAPHKYSPGEVAHKAEFAVSHSFSGIGPSVAWDGSTPFAGTLSDGFSFDWGANAAILFGRQKANVSLLTKNTRYPYGTYYHTNAPVVLTHSTQPFLRNKTAFVPNVGGFAGGVVAAAEREDQLRLSRRFLLRRHRWRACNLAERNTRLLWSLRQCQHRHRRISPKANDSFRAATLPRG